MSAQVDIIASWLDPHFFDTVPYIHRYRLSRHKAGKQAVYLDAQEPVKFFSKLNYFIFGYFDPINIFFDNTNN